MKDKYNLISHNQHAHDILFNDKLMSKKSFMIVGLRETAEDVLNILNTQLEEAAKKDKESSDTKPEIPSVEEVVANRKFHALSTPRYIIEQTILYCAKAFGVETEKS